MTTPAEIVTDAEVERVHANANFGPCLTKRDVVDEGVLTYAFGFTSGYTQITILREHGLIEKPDRYNSHLTKKGYRYLHAMFNNVPLSKILNLRKLAFSDKAPV